MPFIVKQCKYCEYSTKHSGALRRHVESVHLNLKPFQCEVCDKKYARKKELKLHIRSVHEKKTQQCDICFKHYRNLVSHKKQQHQKAICKFCSKELNKYQALYHHIEKEHKDRKVFKCSSCDFTTHDKVQLQRHDQTYHNINYKYCDQCEYRTKLTTHLKQHQKQKHDSNFEKFKCKYCDYQADRKDNVEQHQRSLHENVRYPCDQCAYQATRKQYLEKHIITIHKEIN